MENDRYRPIAVIEGDVTIIAMIFEDVHDKTTLIAFIEELRSELADPIRFGGWENTTFEDFFEAMQAWATDTDNIPVNPWRLAATLTAAGTRYE